MSQTEGSNSRKCILAVDDTVIVLFRISETLRDEYEIVTVNSGARALKYLQEEKPDLILLDIQMSPIDGIETLHKIRMMPNREDIPVIMLTGVENKAFVLESAKLGVRDYLLKPFSSDELLRRIERVFMQEKKEQAQSNEEGSSMT